MLKRVTKYVEYCDCRHFWIDKECINQEDRQEKELAIQSMDLVYSRSDYPVALLSVRIESIEDLNLLVELLRESLLQMKRWCRFRNGDSRWAGRLERP